MITLCHICRQHEAKFDFCPNCIQEATYLQKYPALAFILDAASIERVCLVRSGVASSPKEKLGVICQSCKKTSFIDLISLIKQFKRNNRKRSTIIYRCHPCSKTGTTAISTETLLPVIDMPLTLEKYGGVPKNVKKGMVVVRCEDCAELSDVKLSSVLHQARRHKLNNRACIYKCFSCGVKRKDAIEKSSASRHKQLSEGFRSGLEIATANRLDHLGLKYESQYRVDMYSWDFFLPEHSLLIDVNGEYWHGLPENVAKDKAKRTYTEKYRPDLKILYLEEKRFLNPLAVDKVLLTALNLQPHLTMHDFSFSSLDIRSVSTKIKEERASYVNFLNSYHYSMCGRPGKIVYGAYLDGKLVAVCKFNPVVRQGVASSLGLKVYEVLELDRFCIHPSYQKKNLASWFISRCTKRVFEDFPAIRELVSFADSTYGHAGTIYKAANWSFVSMTRHSYHYMDDLGVLINKKRVYDIASKLQIREADYVAKHGLAKFIEHPKLKFVFKRK